MIRFITDIIRRRSLRQIIRQLPHILKRRYGSAAFYTAEQVRTAAAMLKLGAGLFPSAFAVACSAGEFLKAVPASTEEDYVAKRLEIARLLGIDPSELNCRSLTETFRPSGVENPAEPNALIDRSHHIGSD